MEKQEIGSDKRLVMSKIMNGLEVFLDPLSATTFTVTLGSCSALLGRIAWIKQQLPAWIAVVNQESGALVNSVKIPLASPANHDSPFERSFKIVVTITIPGGVRDFKEDYLLGGCSLLEIDHDVQKMIPGQIKKILAEKIMCNFPWPFNIHEALFAAGHPYHYRLEGWNHNYIYPEVLSNFARSEFLEKLSLCASQYGARLVGVKCEKQSLEDFIKSTSTGTYASLYFVVVWDNRETTNEDHWQLYKALKELIEKELAPIGRKVILCMEG